MSDTPIKTLGKYQIRKELGKGAMGVVYLGFDPSLEREVAIKVMAAAIVSDAELKERFEREAKASAKLQHPNIVTVYDFGYDDQGAPFMAMELLKGQDLEQRIRRNPLTFREKLDVVAQVCRGLSHAHKNQIVHRDMKPANVWITESGEAKIMDFGVARMQTQSQTQTGAVLGTADYMSPEQIRGQKVDGRSDIFSVGVILYRLLTSKKPFAGENIQQVFFKVLNQEAPPLVLPEGSEMPELQAIVDKALSKDVDDRYTVADDLADDIQDLIGLYQEVLNEATVFDTMYDPASVPDMDLGTEGSGRKRTTSTGRILGATSSGSMGRTSRPGTSHPPTATGRTGAGRTVAGRTMGGGHTSVVAPTRMMGRTQMGAAAGTAGGVGIPIDESGGWWKYVAAVVLLIAVGGGVYWFTQIRTPPDVSAGNVNPPPVVANVPTLEERLQTARNALEQELFTLASNKVDEILLEDPANEAALSLKAEIEAAMKAGQEPPPAGGQPPQPTPTGPSPAERAAQFATRASVAIGNGELDQAERWIAQGRELNPGNDVWRELSDQLRRARAQSEKARLDAERQAVVDGFVAQATEHMKAENYRAAIAAYDQALEIDPDNVQIITARNSAKIAMDQVEAVKQVAALEVSESKTEFVGPSGADNQAPGFSGGVNVRRATKAPDNPAEVLVEISPLTVKPGQPYVLRVRIHNQGNRPIGVKSLELVSTYGTQTSGRGQPLTPMVQRVNPRDTSLIYEVRGTWTEDQNQGSIQAVITLIGDALLRKRIEWQ